MSAWDPGTNFKAYANVEELASYPTREQLDAYRRERIGRYEPYVAMLHALRIAEKGMRLVDVGAGSSAFLYALERAGLLRRGLAIEFSRTRHAFAERWRMDWDFRKVENLRANFADVHVETAGFDCFTALDDTYLYLRPEDETYPELLLELAFRVLHPGGLLVLDFRHDLPVVARMPAEGRSFNVDLPESNAFVSARYRQVPSQDRRRLLNESTYVSSSGDVQRKLEVTEVCDVVELAEIVSRSGFSAVQLYGALDLTPFDVGSSPRAVLVAER